MVSLMPSIFSDEHAADPTLEPIDETPNASRIFIPDAFSNPDHLRYILGGTLAAMLCYVFYVSLDWRNLSTSLTTCVLTALTTVGSSRQKQILRIAGFVLGGVITGIGAQIFILPSIDTIGGFTVLFAVVTVVAAWVATSSSRLSYAGVQIAFSFYLIHLSDFSIQTSLTLPRDRVLGVLLGVTMMWLVFERAFPGPLRTGWCAFSLPIYACWPISPHTLRVPMIRPRFSSFADCEKTFIAASVKSAPSLTPFLSKPVPSARATWPPATESAAGKPHCGATISSKLRSFSFASTPTSTPNRLCSPRLRMTYALNVRASSSIPQRALRSSWQPTHTTQTQ